VPPSPNGIVDLDIFKNDPLLRKILDNLYDPLYVVDRDRIIIYWNKSAENLTGFKTEEVVGKSCRDNILVHVDAQGQPACDFHCPLMASIFNGREHVADINLLHKDGHRIPVQVRAIPIHDDTLNIVGAVEIFNDNSVRIAEQLKIDELQKMALLDPLTETGNRRYAEINLQARFDEMKRYDWRFGILFIDIDRFKDVNDTYGHEIGDKVLKMITKTIALSLRSFDFLGRWGGEEFIAIIPNVSDQQLHAIAHRSRALVEQSHLNIDAATVKVTISIGGTLVQPQDTVDSLVQRADRLMYESKKAGRNQVTILF